MATANERQPPADPYYHDDARAVPGLAPLAAHLATAYGADTARIMTRCWARAMRDLAAAGGDISVSHAAWLAGQLTSWLASH